MADLITLPISVAASNHNWLTNKNIDDNLYEFLTQISKFQQEYTAYDRCEFAAYIKEKMEKLITFSHKSSASTTATHVHRILHASKFKEDKSNRMDYLAVMNQSGSVGDKKDTIFCVTCVLFGKGQGVLRTAGTTIENFWKANRKITSHETSKSHVTAYEEYTNFVRQKLCRYILTLFKMCEIRFLLFY